MKNTEILNKLAESQNSYDPEIENKDNTYNKNSKLTDYKPGESVYNEEEKVSVFKLDEPILSHDTGTKNCFNNFWISKFSYNIIGKDKVGDDPNFSDNLSKMDIHFNKSYSQQQPLTNFDSSPMLNIDDVSVPESSERKLDDKSLENVSNDISQNSGDKANEKLKHKTPEQKIAQEDDSEEIIAFDS